MHIIAPLCNIHRSLRWTFRFSPSIAIVFHKRGSRFISARSAFCESYRISRRSRLIVSASINTVCMRNVAGAFSSASVKTSRQSISGGARRSVASRPPLGRLSRSRCVRHIKIRLLRHAGARTVARTPHGYYSCCPRDGRAAA